jgi:hypothetical protein
VTFGFGSLVSLENYLQASREFVRPAIWRLTTVPGVLKWILQLDGEEKHPNGIVQDHGK